MAFQYNWKEIWIGTIAAVIVGISILSGWLQDIAQPFLAFNEVERTVEQTNEMMKKLQPTIVENQQAIRDLQTKTDGIQAFMDRGDRFTADDWLLLESKINNLEKTYTNDITSLREYMSEKFIDLKADIADVKYDVRNPKQFAEEVN